MSLPFHPLANIFPLIEGHEFDELVASIKANGLRDPIAVHDGLVIDGRNRQRACEAAEVACVYHPLPADADPLQFVLDRNLKRRHLNESQRADVAAKLANLSHGGDRSEQAANLPLEPAERPAITQAEAAQMLNVSERLVRAAKAVHDHGTPELRQSISRGHIAVSAAAAAAKFEPETQRRIAAEAEAGKENVVRTVIKQKARAVREIELGAKQAALPQKKYGVILADPEWRFEPYSRETGMDRAPENHYPTSAWDQIAERPVASIAADDCVLFLWATVPLLPEAISVLIEWGFTYKSHCIWDKMIPGTGYWFRNQHEILLVGTRGKPPAPSYGTQLPSIVQAARGEHSAKPELILDWIDRTFPSLPKIELNRRGAAPPGWDAWGNETELTDGAPQMGAVVAPAPEESTGAGALSGDGYEIPALLRRTA